MYTYLILLARNLASLLCSRVADSSVIFSKIFQSVFPINLLLFCFLILFAAFLLFCLLLVCCFCSFRCSRTIRFEGPMFSCVFYNWPLTAIHLQLHHLWSIIKTRYLFLLNEWFYFKMIEKLKYGVEFNVIYYNLIWRYLYCF